MRSIFSEFGSQSMFANGRHNCFTWAIEKLTIIGIFIGEVPLSISFSAVKLVTSAPVDQESKIVAIWI